MAYAGKKFREVQGYGRPRRGSPRKPENFRKFAKNSLSKLQKCSIFANFSKNFKPSVKLSRVWTKNRIGWGNFEKIEKIFDENSIEKLNFYIFFGKFVAKNRAFGNNIIFSTRFFRFGGGV